MDTATSPNIVIHKRITSLRLVMAQHRLDAYIVPSADPHLSEYLPERWQSRKWLTGFMGSVGTLIVTPTFAGLWVDSRYWVQAEAELTGTGIVLMKIQSAASNGHIDWLAEHIPVNGCVGVDGMVLGLTAARAIEQALTIKQVQLRSDIDLLQQIWLDRPNLPTNAVYEHVAPYATQSRAEKLAALRKTMQEKGADWHFVSTLDDIAWLFNLRGADVSYNPVFVAHALIGMEQISLFLAEGKVPADLQSKLAAEGIVIRPYVETSTALSALPIDTTLLIDPRRVTLGLRQAVPVGVKVLEAINPSTFSKSRKSDAEASHVRQAMEQDGAALCEFFSWLESTLGRERITEVTIDEQITAARARRPGFVCPSFATIAGFNANGAMPHYRATPASHAVIEGSGLLLIDSGGQYLNGTTDITRVVAIGEPSAEQKRDFTLVLKGTLALSCAQFPLGLKAPMLDAIARAPIWAAGIDYGHGTGHGVGYFLNVHEGPQSISVYGMPEPHTAMEAGMITSIEPGIYRAGKWGVRIENLVLNVPAISGEFGDYLRFETLTLCPIDTRCLDRSILRADEIDWLNHYHAEVRRRLQPLVSGDALAWLLRHTAPVEM
ncbi:aminopeptidase P family protein [Chitinivorax sp. B]|uniref:aminopeptidase P family protein n=1 Tax=Chitinivorax sp. B TaxID=2502235 RepID=UPI0010F5DC95|nr:aminopeptidase P family protein [Chitinivorax sp. B]